VVVAVAVAVGRSVIGWSVGRLVGESIGWSIGRLVGRSLGESSLSVGRIGFSFCRSVDRSVSVVRLQKRDPK